MRIALLNSGLGLLAAAAQLHSLRPDADLVLAMDPDGMPWGARTPADIAQRSLACARAAADYQPDVLVFACNTGSVHALGALRQEFEPAIPVVGTVPAIKPAAAASDDIAIWATAATTGSAYQRQLIAQFAATAKVAEVACPGLADAIHAGDDAAARAAVSDAATRTPPGCGAIVLGCTEYELATDLITSAVPGAALFGSAAAVAAQAVRRVAATANGTRESHGTRSAAPTGHPAPKGRSSLIGNSNNPSPTDGSSLPGSSGPSDPGAAIDHSLRGNVRQTGAGGIPGDASPASSPGTGTLRVLLSGRPSSLPPAALRYPAGRLLAAMPIAAAVPGPPPAGNPAASLAAPGG
jgi:glutamate racemase